MVKKASARTKTAKQPLPQKADGGPFLASAVFCDNTITDKDQIITAIRIVDGCIINIGPGAPEDFPSKDHPIGISQAALIILKRGDSKDKVSVRLEIEDPKGKRAQFFSQEFEFQPPLNASITIRINVEFQIYNKGFFFIDVFCDDQRMTRMPYNVDIRRESVVIPKKT